MKNLFVYGNIIQDRILTVSHRLQENTSNEIINSTHQVGGIENFTRQFNRLNTNIKVKQVGINSEAIIIINRLDGKRTSIVEWGDEIYTGNFQDDIQCDWLHIMYLDKLFTILPEHLEKYRKRKTIISADLCISNHGDQIDRLSKLFKYINYLIISDVEAQDIQNLLQIPEHVIVHSPHQTIVDGNTVQNPHYQECIVNALGAGDVYSATLVFNLIKGKKILDSIEKAHIIASEFVCKNENR